MTAHHYLQYRDCAHCRQRFSTNRQLPECKQDWRVDEQCKQQSTWRLQHAAKHRVRASCQPSCHSVSRLIQKLAAVIGESLSNGVQTISCRMLQHVVMPVKHSSPKRWKIWIATVGHHLAPSGTTFWLDRWQCATANPFTSANSCCRMTVWVYCGDKEACGADYMHCWLKHLVRHCCSSRVCQCTCSFVL